jgi:hypothetical protein
MLRYAAHLKSLKCRFAQEHFNVHPIFFADLKHIYSTSPFSGFSYRIYLEVDYLQKIPNS